MKNLRNILLSRKERDHSGENVKKYIIRFSVAEKKEFFKTARLTYAKAIDYLDQWFDFSENSIYLKMQDLDLERSIKYQNINFICNNLNIILNRDKLDDECTTFNNSYLSILLECKKDMSHDRKWAYILSKIDLPNLKLVVESVLVIPIGNHYIERAFSIMKNIWKDERGRLKVESVKAELCIKLNFNMSCLEFYEYVKTQDKMLIEVKSQDKYDHINKVK